MSEDGKLYTTAEIMLATGLPRGTITSRALKYKFKRDATGYTLEQVLQIVMMPMELHRKSEDNALELRGKLNETFKNNGIPMEIIERSNGKWDVEYRKEVNGK